MMKKMSIERYKFYEGVKLSDLHPMPSTPPPICELIIKLSKHKKKLKYDEIENLNF